MTSLHNYLIFILYIYVILLVTHRVGFAHDTIAPAPFPPITGEWWRPLQTGFASFFAFVLGYLYAWQNIHVHDEIFSF